MAVRKVQDNQAARESAVEEIDKVVVNGLPQLTADDAAGLGAAIASLFPAIQYEEVTSKVAGEEVTMWRLVMTGRWNVQR